MNENPSAEAGTATATAAPPQSVDRRSQMMATQPNSRLAGLRQVILLGLGGFPPSRKKTTEALSARLRAFHMEDFNAESASFAYFKAHREIKQAAGLHFDDPLSPESALRAMEHFALDGTPKIQVAERVASQLEANDARTDNVAIANTRPDSANACARQIVMMHKGPQPPSVNQMTQALLLRLDRFKIGRPKNVSTAKQAIYAARSEILRLTGCRILDGECALAARRFFFNDGTRRHPTPTTTHAAPETAPTETTPTETALPPRETDLQRRTRLENLAKANRARHLAKIRRLSENGDRAREPTNKPSSTHLAMPQSLSRVEAPSPPRTKALIAAFRLVHLAEDADQAREHLETAIAIKSEVMEIFAAAND